MTERPLSTDTDLLDLRPAGGNTAYSNPLGQMDAHGLRDEMRDFLFAVQAPPNLRAFRDLRAYAYGCLTEARTTWKNFDTTRLDSWIKALECVLGFGGWLDLPDGVFDEPDETMRRRGFGRHAVYAALLHASSSQSQLLLAHLLVAQAECLRVHLLTAEQYESYTGRKGFLDDHANPTAAARLVRTLVKAGGIELDTLHPDRSPVHFLAGLQQLSRKKYQPLVVFLEKAYVGRPQPKVPGRSGAHRKKHDGWLHENYDLRELGEEFAEWHLASYTRSAPLQSEDLDEFDLTDDSVEEAQEQASAGRLAVSEHELGEKSSQRHKAPLTRAAATHVARANQRFWWAYPNLVRQELAPIVSGQREIFLHKWATGNRDEETFEALELFALVDVMLWTASSLDRALTLHVTESAGPPKSDLALVPSHDSSVALWKLRLPLPKRENRPKAQAGLDRSTKHWMELPDVIGASRLVMKLPGVQAGVRQRSGAPVFTRKEDWYKQRITKLVATYGDPQRVTPYRISKYLFERLHAKSGDLVASVLLTGHQVPGTRARLHYVCRPLSALQQLYVDTASEEASHFGESCGLTIITPKSEFYVANDPCPRTAAVQSRVAHLQHLIEQFYVERHDNTSARYLHNVITLYTIWMFGYATGIRGIDTPYLALESCDIKTGIASFVDKDRGAGTHYKLAWLPELVVEQMGLYDAYLNTTGHPNRPCFFLDKDGLPIDVRPSSQRWLMNEDFMKIKGEPFFDYRINIHRRYMLNELATCGCPPQVIDAWAGHWNLGEAPWQPSSTYYWTSARQELKAHIEHILFEKLQFKLMKQFSRRLKKR
jgi:hypothetical protein